MASGPVNAGTGYDSLPGAGPLDRRYAEPSLVNGRPSSDWVHFIALLLAAGADLAAFYQIIAGIMPDLTWWLAALIVSGFTASALYLSHAAGTLLRDAITQRQTSKWVLFLFSLIAWVVLGTVALYVRWLSGTTGSDTSKISIGGGTTDTSDPMVHPKAVLFGALYLATGIVALIGAYLTRNPALSGYLKGLRSYRDNAEEAALAASGYAGARQATARYRGEAERIKQLCEQELEERAGFANELKQYARAVMAAHKQDAPTTDGLFPPPAPDYPPDFVTSSAVSRPMVR